MNPFSADAAHEAARLYRSTGALSDALLRPEITGRGSARTRWARIRGSGTSRCSTRATPSGSSRGTRRSWPQPDLTCLRSRAPQARPRTRPCSATHTPSCSTRGGTSRPARARGGARPRLAARRGHRRAQRPGHPLAEDGYVEIVGPEHFIAGFQQVTCQGIPLRDGAGQVVGALSTSVRRHEVSRRLHDMLLCAAHGIEAELLRASLEVRLADLLATPILPTRSSSGCTWT